MTTTPHEPRLSFLGKPILYVDGEPHHSEALRDAVQQMYPQSEVKPIDGGGVSVRPKPENDSDG